MTSQPLKISKRFASRLNELGFDNERLNEIVNKFLHSFIPVKRVSDAMRESTQVGFNLIDKDNKQYFELVDPENLIKSEFERFQVYQPIRTDDLNVAVGTSLKRARLAQRLTQEELAEKIGMKKPDISTIEAGFRNITLDSLKRVADGLGLKVSIHFDKSDEA